MSDRPIQVGDLVQIVRPMPCCGAHERLGQPFIVSRIESRGMGRHKNNLCIGTQAGTPLAVDAVDGLGAPFSVLKRIPPLDELEGQRTQENIKEPA